jgi:hypothetical protein
MFSPNSSSKIETARHKYEMKMVCGRMPKELVSENGKMSAAKWN